VSASTELGQPLSTISERELSGSLYNTPSGTPRVLPRGGAPQHLQSPTQYRAASPASVAATVATSASVQRLGAAGSAASHGGSMSINGTAAAVAVPVPLPFESTLGAAAALAAVGSGGRFAAAEFPNGTASLAAAASGLDVAPTARSAPARPNAQAGSPGDADVRIELPSPSMDLSGAPFWRPPSLLLRAPAASPAADGGGRYGHAAALSSPGSAAGSTSGTPLILTPGSLTRASQHDPMQTLAAAAAAAAATSARSSGGAPDAPASASGVPPAMLPMPWTSSEAGLLMPLPREPLPREPLSQPLPVEPLPLVLPHRQPGVSGSEHVARENAALRAQVATLQRQVALLMSLQQSGAPGPFVDAAHGGLLVPLQAQTQAQVLQAQAQAQVLQAQTQAQVLQALLQQPQAMQAHAQALQAQTQPQTMHPQAIPAQAHPQVQALQAHAQALQAHRPSPVSHTTHIAAPPLPPAAVTMQRLDAESAYAAAAEAAGTPAGTTHMSLSAGTVHMPSPTSTVHMPSPSRSLTGSIVTNSGGGGSGLMAAPSYTAGVAPLRPSPRGSSAVSASASPGGPFSVSGAADGVGIGTAVAGSPSQQPSCGHMPTGALPSTSSTGRRGRHRRAYSVESGSLSLAGTLALAPSVTDVQLQPLLQLQLPPQLQHSMMAQQAAAAQRQEA